MYDDKEKIAMKRKILFGVCLSALVLLVAPTISAQQYTMVKDTYQFEIEEQINQIISLLEGMDGRSVESDFEIERLVNDFDSLKEDVELIDLDVEPLTIKFLLSTLLSLFFAFLGTIFGNIFGPLLAILVRILTAPAVLLAKIISFLFDGSVVNSA